MKIFMTDSEVKNSTDLQLIENWKMFKNADKVDFDLAVISAMADEMIKRGIEDVE